MTTAARPTWAPAKGGDEQGGTRTFGPSQKFSSRDLASHTKMKPRVDGQSSRNDLRNRDLRGELEDREFRHFSSRDKDDDRKRPSALLEDGGRRASQPKAVVKNIDADDSADDQDDNDESDDDEDEDDTAALMAELERIKKERADEKLKKEKQQAAIDAKSKEAELIRGNPLVNSAGSFAVKRRWDDDVVFRNQTRGERKEQKRFINDTIRSDFHRKFLNKYIK